MEAIFLKIGSWLAEFFTAMKLGELIAGLFPAAIGSALSIFMGAEKIKQLSAFTRLCTFAFGVILGHQIGGAARIEYRSVVEAAFGVGVTSDPFPTEGLAVGFEQRLGADRGGLHLMWPAPVVFMPPT